MATSATTMQNEKIETTIQELNSLIETNLDAVEVLQTALAGLSLPQAQQAVRAQLQDHQAAAQRLQMRVQQLGGQPATDPHASNSLKQSWQKLWQGGDDTAVLLALRANERVAVDGFKVQMTKENWVQTMTNEGLMEHEKALAMDLGHFQSVTNMLRTMGASVDNDEIMGAVRNAAEHIHSAINLTGAGIEAFLKWATGTTK
jgi:uncharacterized protein (TIGR02284 family)